VRASESKFHTSNHDASSTQYTLHAPKLNNMYICTIILLYFQLLFQDHLLHCHHIPKLCFFASLSCSDAVVSNCFFIFIFRPSFLSFGWRFAFYTRFLFPSQSHFCSSLTKLTHMAFRWKILHAVCILIASASLFLKRVCVRNSSHLDYVDYPFRGLSLPTAN
jgi:hypothetical protein